LNEREYHYVFANVKELQQYHVIFYEKLSVYLQPILENKFQTVEVADVIREYFQHLPKYESYLVNYPTANFCLNLLKTKYPAVNQMCSDFDRDLTAKNGLRISDVLIMPVQRLPRYIMLFNTLQKYTKPTHPEHDKLIELQDYFTSDLLRMNSQINPDALKDITLSHSFISSIKELDDNVVNIDLDRRFVERQCFKISQLSNLRKKDFIKKKAFFSIYSDILVITRTPKKGLLEMAGVGKNDSQEEVHTYLDAGVPKNVSFAAQSNTEFTFLLNGETWVCQEEETKQDGKVCKSFVSSLMHVFK